MSQKSDANDSLGNRMKAYETGMPGRYLSLLPLMVRLDGVSFHTFTKGLRRPYDERLSNLMIDTMKMLVKHTNARIGYTQSDEITLLLYSEYGDSQVYFDAKQSKIISTLAAKASVYFNSKLRDAIPEKAGKEPIFDCRAWNVPTKMEAVNAILWREKDAVRNSVSMAAQSQFSHSQLQKKTCSQMHEMLFSEKGINWNDYPQFFKNGTYVQRKETSRKFSADELEKLPIKHAARTNPDLMVVRHDYKEVPMVLSRVINQIDVVFDGAEPFMKTHEAA